MYGDNSTASVVTATRHNQFVVRAAGGTIFYSDPGLTAGVSLSGGGGAWNTISDVRMKGNFRDLSGETVLKRLARIPIREWNYISQSATIRHVGLMAQDFFAAFGLGENNTHISTIDPDGISLLAIQALDARTQVLQKENAALKVELGELRKAIERLTIRR